MLMVVMYDDGGDEVGTLWRCMRMLVMHDDGRYMMVVVMYDDGGDV